jgi:hypothetical protein
VLETAAAFVKENEEWMMNRLPELLVQLSPLLYSQLPIKKEVCRGVATVCQELGQKLVLGTVAPFFLKKIEAVVNEQRMQNLALFLSAVACCDSDFFQKQVVTFITHATNETQGFRHTDINTHIAFSLGLLSARDKTKRPAIFKLVDEFSRSSRSAVRSAAISIISDILQTLEQKELETEVIPVVVKLAKDLDEVIQAETVPCVGTIVRFTTNDNVIRTVKELFDGWFRGKPQVRLQALRALGANAGDIDAQFRDTYIIPKFGECIQPNFGWGEYADQAYVIVIQFLVSLKDGFSENLVRTTIIPMVQQLSENPGIAGDPMLKELKETYKPEKSPKFTDFFQK